MDYDIPAQSSMLGDTITLSAESALCCASDKHILPISPLTLLNSEPTIDKSFCCQTSKSTEYRIKGTKYRI